MKPYTPAQLNPQLILLAEWVQKEAFLHQTVNVPVWILFYVLQGKFHYQIGKHEGIAGPDDLLLCPPHTQFNRHMIRSSTFLIMNFNWFSPQGERIESDRQLMPSPVGKFVIQDMQRLTSTHLHFQKLLDRIDSFALERRNFLLQDLWQLFTWEWDSAQRDLREQVVDPLMKRAEQQLRHHAMGRLSLKSLSSGLDLSAVQFTRRFKAVYGMSPTDYVTSLRLSKVRTLLLETQLTLNEIASQCGYENGLYLSRVFSQKMHISPSQYRQSHHI
ncbi:helix-turn-helix transcriptional regulator [Paenibacillus mesophilus]|uniref:helix-turn-helix transcriptional regulator n=1 Tax=Paenibacillus mesophilus TaxID=2582849 RepID=UPI00110E644E|nr:helix-turn-helix transcriptional regulator [Paenibacillus mesophilus]TMV43530.1 helix-turn-helix transcriptional regulator [Paenibacillus mesophilus]